MTPTLLIITDREDFAADYLIVRLRELGREYYRLNVDQLFESTATFRVGGHEPTKRTVSCGGVSVDLRSVRSVWYRRALRPSPPPTLHPEFRRFGAAEVRHLFEGLVCHPEVCWVNPIAATEIAERKVYQLQLAGQHGLRVPATLVSTNREELEQFASLHCAVIGKPVSYGLVTSSQGQAYALHTHEVTRAQLTELDNLGGVPVLLQERVQKGTDVRVTIIGEAIYSVEIITPADAPVDWRATPEGLRYQRCELPPAIEAACRSLMSALDLAYGAFDFIRTENADWYFLEVNPAGEWAWLDVALGLPMRDSFVELFYGKS